MQRFFDSTRAFKVNSTTLRASYLKSLLLWNPLWTIIITIVMNGTEDFWNRLAIAFLGTTLIMNFCFFGVAFSRLLVARFSKAKHAHPLLSSRKWSLWISIFFMLLSLYPVFTFIAYIAPHLGLHGAGVSIEGYRVGIFFGALIAAFYALLALREEAKESARQTELKLKQLENERLQAQIAALTAQMNPHLLFNALNTVVSLVPTNPELAEETLLKLSELYRGVLDSSREMTHPLEKELRLCEAYLAIERARFGERIVSEIFVASDVDTNVQHIPALCLQPLVENAVKHGLSSRASGGCVWIRITREHEQLAIVVEDDGVGFGNGKSAKGAGSGLKNCRERLSLHFGEQGQLEVSARAGGGTRITLQLPGASA